MARGERPATGSWSVRRIRAMRSPGPWYDGLSVVNHMFRRIVGIFILVLSVLAAIGITSLWFTGYAVDPLRDGRYDDICCWAWDFDSSRGGTETVVRIGSFEGGIYVTRQTDALPSKSQLAAIASRPLMLSSVATPDLNYLESLAGRHEWYYGDATPAFLSPLQRCGESPPAPNWALGGFDFVRRATPVVQDLGVVAPDWFLLAVALIAPAIFIRRSAFWIAGRRVLSGRCRECGCDRGGATGVCPQCGVGPSWAGRQLMRFGNRRWVMWWVPAVVLGLCSLCVPSDFSDFPTCDFGWREVLVGVAFLYMIGVAVARGFVARQPPPEAPRGFEVVMKPPAKGEEGRKGNGR